MNPFAPPVTVRLNNRWRLGDEGAVYEFNIKLRQVWSAASEYDWDDEVRAALEDLEDELRKKYPWIGSVYVTGRSGGWFAIEDPRGKMTKAKVDAIAAMVGTAKRHFVKHMEATYPRG